MQNRTGRMIRSITWLGIISFLIVLLASACSSAGGWKIPPTPAVELAGAYTPGQNDIPAGKYLAVQAWSNSEGRSKNGTCPYASFMDMPTYGMSSTNLVSFVQPEWDYSAGQQPDLAKAVGFFGMGSSHSGDMGGGASSQLLVIQSLPNSGGNSIFVIQSAAADGTIILQVGKQAFRLEPGQSWVQNTESQPDKNCRLLDTITFTNFGLLDGSQITIAGVPLATP
jgi:hypothetical protein